MPITPAQQDTQAIVALRQSAAIAEEQAFAVPTDEVFRTGTKRAEPMGRSSSYILIYPHISS